MIPYSFELQHYPIDLESLPQSWAVASIKDVSTAVQPGFPSGKHNQEGQGVPHLRPMNISREGSIDLSGVKYVQDLHGPRLDDGDVLFNNTNSPALVGKTAAITAPGDWAFSNHMTRIAPARGVSNRYLAFHLHFLWMSGYFRYRCVNHVNQASISSGPLSTTVPLAIPPLAEQERIVAAIEEQFSRLDAGVAALELVLTNLNRYVRAVLRGITGNLPSGGVTAAPAASKGWQFGTIGDLCECLDSRRVPVNKEERQGRQGSIPYYGANGQVGWIDDYLFDEPLVLVVEDETFTGREKPFSYKITGKTWVNNHAHVLRPRPGVNVDYVNFCLMYYPFTPLTTGTTGRRKLTKKALLAAPVAVPDEAEQERLVAEIEQRMSVAVHLEEQARVSLRRARVARESILSAAFSGQLVPQDPNDEPASVLLERITAEGASLNGHKPTRKPRQERLPL